MANAAASVVAATAHTLSIDPNFGWVAIVMALTAFQVIWEGLQVGSVRRKLFNKDFFAKHFPEFKSSFPAGGYPDMGNGRFSAKLSLDERTSFNNYQRAHYNYVEGAASILAFELLSGLFFPRFTTVLGLLYIVGRLLYGIGYRKSGPRGRLVGVLIVDVTLLLLFIASLYGGFTFGGGLDGLKKLISI